MKLTSFLIILLVSVHETVFAQEIENIKTEIVGSNIEIKYDLKSDSEGSYVVDVKLVVGGDKATPIKYITGDLGFFQNVGRSKKIVWDYEKEFPFIDERISFEFESSPMITLPSRLKRGKTYKIPYLIPNNLRVSSINTSSSLGVNITKPTSSTLQHLSLEIPKKMNLGTYQFTVELDNSSVVSSQKFKVFRKIPLFVKVTPIVLAGAAVGYLIHNKVTEPDPDLPTPPSID